MFNTVVTTAVPVGSFIGANLAGILARRGRRFCLIIVNGFHVISLIVMVTNRFFPNLVICRTVYGLTSGFFSTI